MKYLATLACLLSAASAVRHYGVMPTAGDSLMDYGSKFEEDGDMRLAAVFRGDAENTHDGADFLAKELGIHNMTIQQYFGRQHPTLRARTNGLETRDDVSGQCQGHGDIYDHMSENKVMLICGAIAAGSGGTVNTIIEVVESKACVEAGTGHPVPMCKSIFSWIKTTGSGFTIVEVNNFCPAFMSLFTKCKGSDAVASAEGGAISMTGFSSQKDYVCDNVHGSDKHCDEMDV